MPSVTRLVALLALSVIVAPWPTTAQVNEPSRRPSIGAPVPERTFGAQACDPSYPDFCIPPAPPDLNCTSSLIAGRKNFTVRQPDPHNFDADRDGVGCERR